MALIGRALGGALNGNMGVIQTMVGEMITNPKHERKCSCKSTDAWQFSDYLQRRHMLLCHSYGLLEQ
jgi:hypothetical protein